MDDWDNWADWLDMVSKEERKQIQCLHLVLVFFGWTLCAVMMFILINTKTNFFPGVFIITAYFICFVACILWSERREEKIFYTPRLCPMCSKAILKQKTKQNRSPIMYCPHCNKKSSCRLSCTIHQKQSASTQEQIAFIFANLLDKN